ncbi:MAG: polysaccharide biosynthesis/export family protein [Gammaproteobacteria bacterium]|nr:polysaccharide biosynthesis/export family protein [Gammaproteobacteria bacterium]MBU1483026.1 polysaccharide biosynthesis/export family protein [Gammaproteobacteria bacterium]
MFRKVFFALCLLWLELGSGGAVAADSPEIYQLRPGDRVLISVWREDTLQREVVVLPDGSVTFPLIGRVEVAGLSTPEVEQSITAKLKKYIPEPIVTVVIVGIEGSRAYVTGKVLHPGSLIINGPITVLQAISLVGGLDRFADEGGIKVIRAKADGQEILPVNYKDIISGKNVSTNIQLKAGDTLVVP